MVNRFKSSEMMNLQKSSDNYSGLEEKSDSDIVMQRSKSAVVSQTSQHQFQKSHARKAARRSRLKRRESRQKALQASLESINSSSFQAVQSFVTNPSIKDMKSIKESINLHYSTADNRLAGLDYLNKLLKIIKETNQNRSVVAPLAISVGTNPFSGVEASGAERLRRLNNKIKDSLYENILLFTRDYKQLMQTVKEIVKGGKAAAAQSSSNSKTMAKDLLIISQIRALMECINDMIVILSENPAKEAFILNVVLEFASKNE
jgi:hypothetical protein